MKRASIDILPPTSDKKVRMNGDDFGMEGITYIHPDERPQPQPVILTRLLDSDMYFEARQRSFTHPHECFPVLYRDSNNHNHNIYQDTPLGIACRKFSTKTCSNSTNLSSPTPLDFRGYASPPGKRYNTISSEIQQVELIQALYRSCPYQIRCNQMKLGRTPLLDSIMNPNCTFEVRRFMIDGDCHLGAMDSDEGMMTTTMAMRQVDSNRLLPLHHLINQVRRNAVIAPDNDSALKSMHYMIYRCPKILMDVAMDEEEEMSSSSSKSISPLIHLLSQKVGSSHREEAFMTPIVLCAQILLQANPKLIETKSIMSKCSPLHMALRNGYGDFDDLISLLLEYDPMGYQVKSRNMFGDLPVHVAATVGVKKETWSLILNHIIQVTGGTEGLINNASARSLVNGPCTYMWSLNKKGLTPLHLMWMKKVNGDQVKYPNSSRQLGRLERDAFYHDALKTAIHEIAEKRNHEPLASDDKIARDVLGSFWSVLCVFLQGTQLTVAPMSCSRVADDDQGFVFLHAIYALSGPYLPRLFLDLGLTVYPDQVFQSDNYGRLPLHYACSSQAIFNGTTDFQTLEGNEGWKVTSENISNAPLLQHTSSIVENLIAMYPSSVTIPDNKGLLPLAYTIQNEKTWLKMNNMSNFREWCDCRSEGHCVQDHTAAVKLLVSAHPDSLERRNPHDLFEWFMLAAEGTSSHLDTIYYLLRKSPVVLQDNSKDSAFKKQQL